MPHEQTKSDATVRREERGGLPTFAELLEALRPRHVGSLCGIDVIASPVVPEGEIWLASRRRGVQCKARLTHTPHQEMRA